jgi:hypothetical protein
MRPRNELALLPKLPLLITESADEFDAFARCVFEREIEPRGIIGQMYVHDICSIVWESPRLRRGKAAIIDAAFRDALVHLLTECLETPGLAAGPKRSSTHARGCNDVRGLPSARPLGPPLQWDLVPIPGLRLGACVQLAMQVDRASADCLSKASAVAD